METHKRVAALAIADLHLSHVAPIARSCEDWFAVMERQLRQLSALKDEHECPILCAGDLFDRPCPPISLVNWVMANLPQMYCVPGNHDLPCHRREDMAKCSYGTLVEAERIIDLEPGKPLAIGRAGKALVLHGFGCGTPVKPLARNSRSDLALHVAVCHEYVWAVGKGYTGAPDDALVGYKWYSDFWKRLHGYDVAVFGDNHISFQFKRRKHKTREGVETGETNPALFNCGGFFCRKSDERGHKPSVGLIHEDGTVSRQYLDVSADKWLDPDQVPAEANGIGFQGFIEQLGDLGAAAMDFAASVHRSLERDKVPQEVKDFMLAALEGKQ